MRCEEAQMELATARPEDAADPELRAALAAHVAACARCRDNAEIWKQLNDSLGQGPLWNLPVGFAQGVGSRMTIMPRPDRLESQWDIPAAAGCGLIAVFVGVLLLIRPVSALSILGVISGYISSDAGLYACLALGVAVWFARRMLVGFASFCSSIGVATTSVVLRLPLLTRRS